MKGLKRRIFVLYVPNTCRIEEGSCSTRGGVNSAFFKFFKDRETFEEFSCKTLLNHRDKSQQHTRDLYWFGLLTYSSPQATPLENSLKTLVKHLTRNKAPWQTPAPVPPFSLPLLQEIISPFTQVQHNLYPLMILLRNYRLKAKSVVGL